MVVIIKKKKRQQVITSVREGVEKLGFSCIDNGTLTGCCHFGKLFGSFLNSKFDLPLASAILLLGKCSREIKTYVHTKSFMWMCVEALFIIVKSGNYAKVCQLLKR